MNPSLSALGPEGCERCSGKHPVNPQHKREYPNATLRCRVSADLATLWSGTPLLEKQAREEQFQKDQEQYRKRNAASKQFRAKLATDENGIIAKAMQEAKAQQQAQEAGTSSTTDPSGTAENVDSQKATNTKPKKKMVAASNDKSYEQCPVNPPTSRKEPRSMDQPFALGLPLNSADDASTKFNDPKRIDRLQRLIQENPESELKLHCLRPGLSNPTTIVRTNHFSVNLPDVELFEYRIQGIPPDLNRQKTKKLILEYITTNPQLKQQQACFATDFRDTIVAWRDLSDFKPVPEKDKDTASTNATSENVTSGQQVGVNTTAYGSLDATPALEASPSGSETVYEDIDDDPIPMPSSVDAGQGTASDTAAANDGDSTDMNIVPDATVSNAHVTDDLSTDPSTLQSQLTPFQASIDCIQQAKKKAANLDLEEVKRVDLTPLMKYVDGVINPDYMLADLAYIARILNIIVAKKAHQHEEDHDFAAVQVGPNKFFPLKGHAPLGKCLLAIRGYFVSIRPGMGRCLLNVNVGTSAFFNQMMVTRYLNDFEHRSSRYDSLVGIKVFVHTDRYGNAATKNKKRPVKTISGWSALRPKEQKFDWTKRDKNGDVVETETNVSVYDFFGDKHHHYSVRDDKTLCANLGSTQDGRQAWYPAELLEILPYQAFPKKGPDVLAAKMIETAARSNSETRTAILHEALPILGLEPNDDDERVLVDNIPSKFTIAKDMLAVNARIIGKPSIGYSYDAPSKKARFMIPKWNAQWTLVDMVFLHVPKFMVRARFFHGDDVDYVTEHMKAFQEEVSKYGPNVFATSAHPMDSDPWTADSLKAVLAQAKSEGINFAVLLLPEEETERYRVFKSVADQSVGMFSTCLVEAKNRKSIRQVLTESTRYETSHSFTTYMANVAMKVNLKLGGTNHEVRANVNASALKLGDKQTKMVLGADVIHPSAGSAQRTPSITAVVGSVDRTASKFLGSMRYQYPSTGKESKEIIEDLHDMVVERLRDWFRIVRGVKGTPPSDIIYYRDGISESEYTEVRRIEVNAIRSAFKTVFPKTTPAKVTAIICAKRHHVRFFPTRAEDLAKSERGSIPTEDKDPGNLKPGLVVDTGVTSPYYHDFYLQSHHGLKGTAKPTHYFVLEDDRGWGAEALQDFTHKLCYSYQRATMGVSYATPAYYADHLAERGRCYLKRFYEGTNKGADDALNLEQFEDEVKKAWNGGDATKGKDRNPFHDNLKDTMFWL
ncbi:hypothetical protein LTS18_011295 [Coniosporium uncinatum]|uniref:Uncharacterized protein n=1 Tax=Coniosporium uncinatum TaxID=93489 RepID=A0ACC3DWF6_9PEZI|nr:hypothetical protein LTS18_011295 [Coniosporium uncinatum]